MAAVALEWRELLVEVFAEAERKGLGELRIGFNATPGMDDQAADFVEARCVYLLKSRIS